MKPGTARSCLIPLTAIFAAAVGYPASSRDAYVAREVGRGYLITYRYETESSTDGEYSSSSSSSGSTSVVERVVAWTDEGYVLHYDYPRDGGERSASDWQMPAQLRLSEDGEWTLLNESELIARRDEFLRLAELSPDACDRWIFTWNAFQIECDPQSAIEIARHFDISQAGLAAGSAYSEEGALEAGILRHGDSDDTYDVEFEIDPAFIHRGKAESAVIAAEIMGDELSLADALTEQQQFATSGFARVAFELDAAGHIVRRTRHVTIKQTSRDGETETSNEKREWARTEIGTIGSAAAFPTDVVADADFQPD